MWVCVCVCKEISFKHRFYILLDVSLFCWMWKLKKEVVYSEKELGASGSLAIQWGLRFLCKDVRTPRWQKRWLPVPSQLQRALRWSCVLT